MLICATRKPFVMDSWKREKVFAHLKYFSVNLKTNKSPFVNGRDVILYNNLSYFISNLIVVRLIYGCNENKDNSFK